MQIHVLISLLMRCLAAVAFDIGHSATDYIALALGHADEIFQKLVVVSAVFFIDFIGDRKQRIQGVHADAALKAGAS
jgi:hypothetical protein